MTLLAWKADIDRFVAELHIRAPLLVVKRGRFTPIWCLASWSNQQAAWAGFNRIVVSEAALDYPVKIRRYLLAHELGHLAKRHTTRQSIALMLMLLLWTPSARGMNHAPHVAILLKLAWAWAFLCCAFDFVRLAVTCVAEYEADAIAVRLIGRDQVIHGILEMAKLCGEGLTSKRRLRLKKWGAMAERS